MQAESTPPEPDYYLLLHVAEALLDFGSALNEQAGVLMDAAREQIAEDPELWECPDTFPATWGA